MYRVLAAPFSQALINAKHYKKSAILQANPTAFYVKRYDVFNLRPQEIHPVVHAYRQVWMVTPQRGLFHCDESQI